MFNAYEFVFNGDSSFLYGLMIYDLDDNKQTDVSFGNKASIIETRISRRIQPIHFGVNYHESPLEFKLVFGSERDLDRYELEEISKWLTGYQDYRWLQICQPDLSSVQFRCLITELKPISVGWLPVAFEATVVCDCPYAYGDEFQYRYTVSGSTDIVFQNGSTIREYWKPRLSISPRSGVTDFSIVNHSDNDREFKLSGIPPSDLNISVDNANCMISELNFGYNLYGNFNYNFLRFVPGDNHLTVTGDGVITISGRFLHNVGG